MTKAAKVSFVVVVMACFATNSIATRFLVSRGLLDPAAVTIARFVAGACMLAVILAGKGSLRQTWPRGADTPLVFVLGGYALAIAYGYRHITAAAGTFVFYALVIATMTAGGPRPTRRAGFGAAIALCGVGLLAVGKVAGTTPVGVILLAFTGLTWGAYSLVLRRRGSPLATNARAFIGVSLLLPVLAWVERDHLVFSSAGLLIGVGMGAITTALAYALWARVLPHLTPIEAGTFQLLVPVLTAATGVIALGEPFSQRLAIAGALVLSGMWLTASPRRNRAEEQGGTPEASQEEDGTGKATMRSRPTDAPPRAKPPLDSKPGTMQQQVRESRESRRNSGELGQ